MKQREMLEEIERLRLRVAELEDTQSRLARTEDLLRDSEERFRVLYGKAPLGYQSLDDKGCLVEVNQSWLRTLGYNRDEVLGRWFGDFLAPEYVDYFRNNFTRFKATGEIHWVEFEMLRKEGSRIPVVLDGQIGLDRFGRFKQTHCILRDVSELKRFYNALAESEERYRRIVETANEGIWVVDAEFLTTFVNQRMAQMLGYSIEEMIGKHLDVFIFKDDLPVHRAQVELKGLGSPSAYEIRLERKDGLLLWARVSASVLKDSMDRPVGSFAMLTDVTDLRTMEKDLRESEEFTRQMIHDAPFGMVYLTVDGVIAFTNPASNRIFEIPEDEASPLVGLNALHLPRIADQPHAVSSFKALVQEGKSQSDIDISYRSPLTGKHYQLLVSGTPRFSADGSIVGSVIMIADITERKKFEEELRQSERRYRKLFEGARDAIIIFELEGDNLGRIVDANQVAADMHGYERSELLTLRVHDLDAAESTERTLEWNERILEGEWLREETIHRKKDGAVFPVEISVSLVEIENRKLALAIERDITERKQSEAALLESEARFRALSDATFESIFLSENGVCSGQNLAAERTFGYSTKEAIGRAGTDWIAPEHREAVFDDILSGNEAPYESVALRKDGTTFPCEIQGKMIHHDGRDIRVTALRDITDRKRAAELVVLAERRRVISDLTSGVAHNFRNWLQVIVGSTRVALQDLDSQEYGEIRVSLEKIMKAAHSGSNALTRLEQVDRMQNEVDVNDQKIFDISGTVRAAVEMTKSWRQTTTREGGMCISLRSDLTEGAWVLGSEVELFEVFVNLIANAAEAIKNDGEIVVETSVEGDKSVIRISDTGVGVAPQNIGRIFEPFWTTKAGVGTGLGLSTSASIVDRYAGSISVESQVGLGSTFTVAFPLVRPPSDNDGETSETELRKGLRVLVIDDMDSSAKLMAIQLTRLGCAVVSSTKGEEAIQRLGASDFDLVISDLVMPGINGWEIGKAIRSVCEERGIRKIPFILVTGVGGGRLEEHPLEESGVDAVVTKPVDNSQLIRIIQEVIPGYRDA